MNFAWIFITILLVDIHKKKFIIICNATSSPNLQINTTKCDFIYIKIKTNKKLNNF